jgi:hypothetical protein
MLISRPEVASSHGGSAVPELREQTASTCWECDAPTESPIVVALRTLDGHTVTLTICEACYRTYCKLFASVPVDGIETGGTTVAIDQCRPGRHPQSPGSATGEVDGAAP